MKRSGGIIKGLVIAVLLGSMLVTPVQAAEWNVPYQERLSILEEQGLPTVSDTSYSNTRSNYLNSGHISLSALDIDKVNVYGITQCYRSVEKVYLNLFLTEKDTDSYHTYKYWEFVKNDSDYLHKEIEVLVPPGYYYSLQGSHAAKEGDTLETTGTMTDGLYIGW